MVRQRPKSQDLGNRDPLPPFALVWAGQRGDLGAPPRQVALPAPGGVELGFIYKPRAVPAALRVRSFGALPAPKTDHEHLVARPQVPPHRSPRPRGPL